MRLSFKIKGRQTIALWLMLCFILPSIVFAGTFTAFTGQINASGINVRVDATVGAEIAFASCPVCRVMERRTMLT